MLDGELTRASCPPSGVGLFADELWFQCRINGLICLRRENRGMDG